MMSMRRPWPPKFFSPEESFSNFIESCHAREDYPKLADGWRLEAPEPYFLKNSKVKYDVQFSWTPIEFWPQNSPQFLRLLVSYSTGEFAIFIYLQGFRDFVPLNVNCLATAISPVPDRLDSAESVICFLSRLQRLQPCRGITETAMQSVREGDLILSGSQNGRGWSFSCKNIFIMAVNRRKGGQKAVCDECGKCRERLNRRRLRSGAEDKEKASSKNTDTNINNGAIGLMIEASQLLQKAEMLKADKAVKESNQLNNQETEYITPIAPLIGLLKGAIADMQEKGRGRYNSQFLACMLEIRRRVGASAYNKLVDTKVFAFPQSRTLSAYMDTVNDDVAVKKMADSMTDYVTSLKLEPKLHDQVLTCCLENMVLTFDNMTVSAQWFFNKNKCKFEGGVAWLDSVPIRADKLVEATASEVMTIWVRCSLFPKWRFPLAVLPTRSETAEITVDLLEDVFEKLKQDARIKVAIVVADAAQAHRTPLKVLKEKYDFHYCFDITHVFKVKIMSMCVAMLTPSLSLSETGELCSKAQRWKIYEVEGL